VPRLLIQAIDDRHNRFALGAQKGPQHFVVGFAFVIPSHIHSPRTLAR
jgi:hypothetical protein